MSAEYENMQVEKWVNLEDVAEHLSYLSQDKAFCIPTQLSSYYQVASGYAEALDQWPKSCLFSIRELHVYG